MEAGGIEPQCARSIGRSVRDRTRPLWVQVRPTRRVASDAGQGRSAQAGQGRTQEGAIRSRVRPNGALTRECAGCAGFPGDPLEVARWGVRVLTPRGHALTKRVRRRS